MNIRTRTLLAASTALLALTGCSGMTTEADQVGIRYEGGIAQAPTFKECQTPGQQHYGDPGDGTYTYPAGQRTAKFSDDPADLPDFPALRVSSPAPGGGQPIEMTVKATIYFTPRYDNCDLLRDFHERIGRKYEAWLPEGWLRMMGAYIGDPVDLAADRAALASNWVALTSDGAAKDQWAAAVQDAVAGTPGRAATATTPEVPPTPGLIEKAAGGAFFTVDQVLLQLPTLPATVRAAIDNTEKARQEAATADAVKRAAESFPGGLPAYLEFQRAEAVNEAIRTGRVPVIPVPAGSDVIVNSGG